MEGLFSIFGQMVTLFSIIGVGYWAKTRRFMTAEFDRMLSKLILMVALPALLVGSVLTAEHLPSLRDILVTFGVSCASYVVIIALAYLVTGALRTPAGRRGVFKFMVCFGNVGFIGFPVLLAIFGPEALIYATVFNLPFNLLVFTVGAWFLTQDGDEGKKVVVTWRTFVSPTIAACVAAIVLTLFGIHQVPVLGDACATLGSLTTPASLLIVGSSLANLPARELVGTPRLWVVALTRLIAAPLVMWAIFHPLVDNQLLLGVIVVISGMPVATNGTMLCYQYGGNAKTMAQGTFVTTIGSLASIPLLVSFLGAVM